MTPTTVASALAGGAGHHTLFDSRDLTAAPSDAFVGWLPQEHARLPGETAAGCFARGIGCAATCEMDETATYGTAPVVTVLPPRVKGGSVATGAFRSAAKRQY